MTAENVVYLAVGIACAPLAWYARRLFGRSANTDAVCLDDVGAELPEPIAKLRHGLATTEWLDPITITRDDARAIIVHERGQEAALAARESQLHARIRQMQYLEGRNDVLVVMLRAPEAVTITRRGDAHVVRVGSHEASALDIAEALRSALESRRQFEAEHRDALRSQEGYL